MPELLAAWLLFPAVLGLIALGCGLLIDRLAGRVGGVLLMPLGLAAIFVVARLFTSVESFAPLALPALLLLAGAGFLAGGERLRRARPDPWSALSAFGVFLVFGAPVFLTGHPTFAGSLVLPDTSNQLALAAFTPEHGHAWQALQPSSFQNTLYKYLTTEYPLASQATLGVLAPLGTLAVAWLYQPLITFAAAMTALAMYALLGPWVRPPPVRAAASFLAAQPALLVSFALQGSIKEVTAVPMLALTAALAAAAITERAPARAFVPTAVAAGAALGAIGVPSAAYLAPMLLPPVAVLLLRSLRAPTRGQLIGVGVLLVAALLVALPALSGASKAVTIARDVLAQGAELGNLARPLQLRQAAGIWLNGDYRFPPQTGDGIAWALELTVAAAAAAGLVWALRRRALGPLLFSVPIAVASIPLLRMGTPYADSKVLMFLAPAVAICAVLGIWSLRGLARGVPALLLALVLGGGVLLSNALAYHDVQHAPYERYSELLDINSRFAGEGRALFNEYDEYGGYLLRDLPGWNEPERTHEWRAAPKGPTELSRRPTLKLATDLDDLRLRYVESFPLLVLRRSPTTSRPPSNYGLAYRGRWYEVWRRAREPRVLEHLSLRHGLLQPAAHPSCRDVRRLGRRAARAGGRLAYVARPRLVAVEPARVNHSPNWVGFSAYPGALLTYGPGAVEAAPRLRAGARYRLWLEGSFGRGVAVRVDGHRTGYVSYQENNPSAYEQVGTADLRPGRHQIKIERGGGDLRPGNGGEDGGLRHVGPLVFSPLANEARRVRVLPPGRADELCGRRLDWVEAVS